MCLFVVVVVVVVVFVGVVFAVFVVIVFVVVVFVVVVFVVVVFVVAVFVLVVFVVVIRGQQYPLQAGRNPKGILGQLLLQWQICLKLKKKMYLSQIAKCICLRWKAKRLAQTFVPPLAGDSFGHGPQMGSAK